MKGWGSFIRAARAADHAVQVYDDLAELQRIVCAFVAAGFEAGEPSIVIATEEHVRAFEHGLEAAGLRPAEDGLLVTADAEETLAAFMRADGPDEEAFEAVVGELLDETAARFPGATIRAFGEMVDLLWRRGEERAACELEELWNELAATRDFALLCAYRLDIFDADVQRRALPAIFAAHTHVRPAADPAAFNAAVDLALTESVGPFEAARIYLAVAEQVPRRELPRAQAVLSWLSANRAGVAELVLERLRGSRLQSTSG